MVLALQPPCLFEKTTASAHRDCIGYFIMLIAVLCYSIFAVCQRVQQTDEVLTLFMRTTLTTIIFGVCSLFIPWQPISVVEGLSIAFLIFLNTASLLLLTVG